MPDNVQTRDRHCLDAALVLADFDSGGAQQVACQLANAWAVAGRRVAVITFAAANSDFFTLDARVERIGLGVIGNADASALRRLVGTLRRVAVLRRSLKRLGGAPAIGFIVQTNILLIAASFGLGCRVIVSERNDPARQSFGFLWDALRRLLYGRANLVTANSRGALETLAHYVPRCKLAYVPNILRSMPDARKADSNSVPRQRLILNIARLHPQKGQDCLIRAFASVAPGLPGWRLVILGEGVQRSVLEELVRELGLTGRVELPGRVENPFPWYREAGMFVLPSRLEGTPNALLEAMSCKAPCIVSDASPGPLELVEDGRSGLVVPIDDSVALAGAMQRLADDSAMARRLGAAAQERVATFRPEAALAAWDELIAGVERG